MKMNLLTREVVAMGAEHAHNVVYILILDPDRDMGELFRRSLEKRRNNRCLLTFDEQEALSILQSFPIHLMLVDITLLSRSHFQLLHRILSRSPHTILLADGYINHLDLLRYAVTKGAHGYFAKPISVEACRKIVETFSGGCVTSR